MSAWAGFWIGAGLVAVSIGLESFGQFVGAGLTDIASAIKRIAEKL